MDKHRLFLQTYQKKAIKAAKKDDQKHHKSRIVYKRHTIKKHARTREPHHGRREPETAKPDGGFIFRTLTAKLTHRAIRGTKRLTMKSTEELRKEFNTLRNSGLLKSVLGCECVNCNSVENIEYHHIVPLHLGGTNNIRNIVPLCNVCHKAVTHGGHRETYKGTRAGGRKPNVPDKKVFKILDKWADGQIGNKKCCELIGVKQSKSSDRGAGGVINTAQYKKWCKKRGYEKVKNILDTTVTNGRCCVTGSTRVGTITRLDGSDYPIYFNDTGLNDDVMYMIRGTNEEKPFRLIKSGLQFNMGAHFIDFRFESSGQLSFW